MNGPQASVSKEEKYFGGKREEVIESVSIGENTPDVKGSMVTLYGKIWDVENGQSLIGATIYFTETKTGTVTDIDGRYQIVLTAGSYLVSIQCPGIQSVGEGASGFNVRGSSADQNMFYINKVPVYNTSHLFGFFSSFSPVTGHVAVEGPIKKGKHSFVLSTCSTYSDWIFSLLEDPALRNSTASFYDVSAGITLEPDEKNLIKIFGYYTSDKFHYEDFLAYDYNNSGSSVSWRHRISPSLTADMAAVFGNYSFGTVNQEYLTSAYEHNYQIGHYEIKSDFSWVPVRKHIVSFGGSIIYYDLYHGEVRPFGSESNRLPVNLGLDRGTESAIYLGDKYELLPKLTIYGGQRYSMFNNLGPAKVYDYYPDAPRNPDYISDTSDYAAGRLVNTYSGPDIRTALNYKTGINSLVKLSYNRIRQYIFLLSNTIAIAPTDQWKLCDYHIRPPFSDQIAAGLYKDFPLGGIRSSVEGLFQEDP